MNLTRAIVIRQYCINPSKHIGKGVYNNVALFPCFAEGLDTSRMLDRTVVAYSRTLKVHARITSSLSERTIARKEVKNYLR